MNNQPISIEKVYNAPIEKVWQAITDKEQMKDWYFDLSDFKAEPGFEFQFEGVGKTGEKFLHLCKVTEVLTGTKLGYSWKYDGYEGISFVSFELFDEDGKTRVKLTHSGLESFPQTANDDFAKENFQAGWTEIIGRSLKEFVEK